MTSLAYRAYSTVRPLYQPMATRYSITHPELEDVEVRAVDRIHRWKREKFALIRGYADRFGKMTDFELLVFIRNWLDSDIATT